MKKKKKGIQQNRANCDTRSTLLPTPLITTKNKTKQICKDGFRLKPHGGYRDAKSSPVGLEKRFYLIRKAWFGLKTIRITNERLDSPH